MRWEEAWFFVAGFAVGRGFLGVQWGENLETRRARRKAAEDAEGKFRIGDFKGPPGCRGKMRRGWAGGGTRPYVGWGGNQGCNKWEEWVVLRGSSDSAVGYLGWMGMGLGSWMGVVESSGTMSFSPWAR